MKQFLKTFGIQNNSSPSTPQKSEPLDLNKLYEQVKSATEVIRKHTQRITNVQLDWSGISEMIGCSGITLKPENLQTSGSFEFRGALFYFDRKFQNEESKQSTFIVQDYCGSGIDHCLAFAAAAKVCFLSLFSFIEFCYFAF